MSILATIDHFEEAPDAKGGRLVTYYFLTVRTFTEEPQLIKKRYSEFLALHVSLQAKYPSVKQFPFPKKSFYGGSTQTERMIAFEEYLHLILEINPVPEQVLQFLDINSGINRCSGNNVTSSVGGFDPTGFINKAPTSSPPAAGGAFDSSSTPAIAPHHVEHYLTGLVYTLSACFMISVIVLIEKTVRTHFHSEKPFSLTEWIDVLINGAPVIALRGIYSWKFACEVIIAFLIFSAFLHRILGYAVEVYITRLLGTPHGAFKMKFGWISLRLGLDLNEIKISDYYWMNPYRFAETPYFIRVGSVSLRFDIATLFAALLDPSKSVDIKHFEIEDVEVYIEKGKRRGDGLNIWAALGAINEQNEEEVLHRVQRSIKASLRLTTSAVKTVASVPVSALKVAVKYNPVSLVAHGVGSAIAYSQKSSRAIYAAAASTTTTTATAVAVVERQGVVQSSGGSSNVLSRLATGALPTSQSSSSIHHRRGRSSMKSDATATSTGTNSSKSMWSLFTPAQSQKQGGSGQDQGRGGGGGVMGDTNDADTSYASEDGDGSDDDSSDDDDNNYDPRDVWRASFGEEGKGGDNVVAAQRKQTEESQKLASGTTAAATKQQNKDKKPMPPHWGIPLVFNVQRLSIRDVKVFAQDYLNAKHSEAANQSAIVLDLISMSHRELSRRGRGNAPNAPREGLHLDEIVWRGVGRLVNEVLSTNKVAMLQVMTSAAFNQTSYAVQGAAQAATVKVAETVYNYNPKELFHGTKQIFQNMLPHSEVEPSEEIRALKINKIRVRLYKVRTAIFKNERVSVPVFCTFTMRNQLGCLEDSMVSSHRQPDREDGTEAVFDESFTLIPVVSLDAVVHIRLYKSNLLFRDECIGEALLSLRSELLVDSSSSSSSCGAGSMGKGQQSVESSSNRSDSDVSRAVRIADAAEDEAKEIKGSSSTNKVKAVPIVPAKKIGLQTEVIRWHTVGLKTTVGCSGELLLGISAIAE